MDQARLNLQYATIRAPIAGRTGSLRVREGNLVRATDAAAAGDDQPDPADPGPVRGARQRTCPPIQRYRGTRRSPCWPQPAAGGGSTSEGTLAFVDNAVDTTTGTILLKGTLSQRRRRALARASS